MKGRRVYQNDKGGLPLASGDYGLDQYGEWLIRPPGCHAGGIPDHEVKEHSDGTITVSPSIVLSEMENGKTKEIWHGYLINGEWQRMV